MKLWKGPHKPVINILEAGLHVIGWARCDDNHVSLNTWFVLIRDDSSFQCTID